MDTINKPLRAFGRILAMLSVVAGIFMLGSVAIAGGFLSSALDFYTILAVGLICFVGGIYGFRKMGKSIAFPEQHSFTTGFFFGFILPAIAFGGYFGWMAMVDMKFKADNAADLSAHCTNVVQRDGYSFTKCDDGRFVVDDGATSMYFADQQAATNVIRLFDFQVHVMKSCVEAGSDLIQPAASGRICNHIYGTYPELPSGWSYGPFQYSLQAKTYSLKVTKGALSVICDNTKEYCYQAD